MQHGPSLLKITYIYNLDTFKKQCGKQIRRVEPIFAFQKYQSDKRIMRFFFYILIEVRKSASEISTKAF